ncbi:hypothetical protein ACFV29_12910 [Streptomyces sp. NPDC059690]|uniref:hypothetical protein n=1 Tax=Streptomyces sp. NPDC059690 TaxID=3346907 RepID=UPI0036B94200
MEMRRQDSGRPVPERVLLWLYWILSGYGLRATRALGWLVATMAGVAFALMLWGLPTGKLEPTTTGKVTGDRITLTTRTPPPEVTGNGRITLPRAEKASLLVVNSAFFRVANQNLTTLGTAIDMAARFVEPALLALTVLAVRGRVKR